MKLREQSITNILSFLTIIISLIIAVSIPVTYFIVVYQYMDGTINAEIAFSARAVEEIVAKNPKSWQFEGIRLQEILGRRLDNHYRDNRRIRDLRGHVVAQTKETLAHPVATFSQPVYDSGKEVARIEIERSIIPLVTNTVLLGVFSTLSGVLFFIFYRCERCGKPMINCRKAKASLRRLLIMLQMLFSLRIETETQNIAAALSNVF